MLLHGISEELDNEIEVRELFNTVECDYPIFNLSLDYFACPVKSSELVLKEHEVAKMA